MKLYSRLAWDCIRKNRRLYVPYLITCSCMVMLLYIIHYLAAMPSLRSMPGGDSAAMMLGMGVWIVILFALIFLLYTNSFLVRRRQKELGLYNILGMGKKNLSLLLLWETGIVCAMSICAGMLSGVLLSKLAELGLTRMLGGEISYDFSVSVYALEDTALVFLPIFALIYLKSLWQLWRMSAVALLSSESVGEKPPRANYLLGAAGVIVLLLAYYIAVSIKNPLAAMMWFFIAAGMVVLATYMLFIFGSVVLCRLLRKNKGYYYKRNHFISVSAMAYRMKRNGAGLASICILSTMVLVMLVGAGSLYIGKEESLRSRYPKEINVCVDFVVESDKAYSEEKEERIMAGLEAVLTGRGLEPAGEELYRSAVATGMLRDGALVTDPAVVNAAELVSMDDVCNVYIVPLADYNRCMGTDEKLGENEVMLYSVRYNFTGQHITLPDGAEWSITKRLEAMVEDGSSIANVLPSLFFVVKDIDAASSSLGSELGEDLRVKLNWAFDTNADRDAQTRLAEKLKGTLRELEYTGEGGFYSASVESREEARGDFYGSFGGIFFLGIILSLVFISATVLIIYYKQITEGYEDERRFEIMRKVGLTGRDIRKNVNSQMLTVFFMPLVTAVLHLCFAFPMIKKLLLLFALSNDRLAIAVMAVTVLIFAAVYAAIYKATSNTYCAIVSGQKEE